MKWLVSVILGLLPISAFASDMNYPTKAMPSYYNWSGFYAGLNVGGAFGNASVTDTNGGVPAGPYAYQPKGVFGGGQAGFSNGSTIPGVTGSAVLNGNLGPSAYDTPQFNYQAYP